MRRVSLFVLFIGALLLTACSPGSKIGKRSGAFITKEIEASNTFAQHFTGLSIMDVQQGEFLYNYDGDKYFTPASNTKILSLYTCLNILGDSIPALYYEIQGDSLFFWGTGDPSLLNPNLEKNTRVLDFLRGRSERLFYCPGNFIDQRMGAGWAWDDYGYSFQAEKSALPIQANLVQFEKESNSIQFSTYPSIFGPTVQHSDDIVGNKAALKRQLERNGFEYNLIEAIPHSYKGAIPFHYSDKLLVLILQEYLQRPVELYTSKQFPTESRKMIYSSASDDAYRVMMQESNNFIAEQLLLVCAGRTFPYLNTSKIIQHTQTEYLQGLDSPVIWVDGSGLSRYNLVTPNSLTQILHRIYKLAGEDYVKKIFPTGGASGTIKDWYGAPEKGKPYVFAKTGTLKNNHNLSGYLKAKSGRLLAFSFMHNHFPGSSKPIKEEMERMLQKIYVKY